MSYRELQLSSMIWRYMRITSVIALSSGQNIFTSFLFYKQNVLFCKLLPFTLHWYVKCNVCRRFPYRHTYMIFLNLADFSAVFGDSFFKYLVSELFLFRNILTNKHTFWWRLHLHVKEIYLYTLSEYMIHIPHFTLGNYFRVKTVIKILAVFAHCLLASNLLLVCILVIYGYSCTVMICLIL